MDGPQLERTVQRLKDEIRIRIELVLVTAEVCRPESRANSIKKMAVGSDPGRRCHQHPRASLFRLYLL